MNSTDWIKASASGGGGGNCVEMRRHNDAIEVRDSKVRQRHFVTFSARRRKRGAAIADGLGLCGLKMI